MLLSARQLATQSANAAACLRPLVGGKPVAALTHSAAALGLLTYATAELELPLLLLDPALPREIIDTLLEKAGAGLIVGDADYPGRRVFFAADLLAVKVGQGKQPTLPDSERIALMVATSGSSGQPKAVMLTGRNLRAAAVASATRTPLGSDDRWLACLPLFHIGGYSILYRCALAGAEALLMPKFDAREVWEALVRERISHVSLVPSMLAQLLEISEEAPPPSLRHVLIGGAALSGELAARAVESGWPLQPTYGMSETASQVATLHRLALSWHPGSLGTPLPGVELAVQDNGRLKIRGPMVMAGYANPDLTPGDGLENGWFITGDLAEISPEGELCILGRAGEVIISGGKKIHPQRVENELAQCPGVDNVAVIGTTDPVWGEVVTAVFAGALSPEELLAWCRAHFQGSHRPRRAVYLSTWPLLGNGKLDRQSLRKLAEEVQAKSD